MYKPNYDQFKKNVVKIIVLLLCISWFAGVQVFAQTNVSGLISSNTVWSLANSPYIVTGNILVNNGVTLTIEPGVSVKFNSLLSLQIDGILLAQGTSGNKIVFTSNTTQAAGAWGYIYFSDASADAVYENDIYGNYLSGSILEYCIIQYAGGASVTSNGALRLDAAHPFVNYCTISDNNATGINAYNLTGSLKISNSTISYNTSSDYGEGGGIYFYNDPYSGSGTSVISGNTISNNYAASAGGGIYTIVSNYRIIVICNNIILNNTSYNGGGIYNAYSGNAYINNNVIFNNSATGGGGAGICNNSSANISANLIINNISSENQFGGGAIFNSGSDVSLNKNIISDNISTGDGGGLYILYSGAIILNNQILRNIAKDNASIYYDSYENISFNTIAYNKNTDFNNNLNRSIYITDNHPNEINNNNIFNNSAFYELYNSIEQGTANITATNNWWGTANDADIQGKIHDWFDDVNLGIVNYSPYLTTPDIIAPVSPPASVTKTNIGGDQVKITWSPNPEADVAGYHVYYGGFNGYSFTNLIDAGIDTLYILTSVSITDTIGVTAYDNIYTLANESDSTIVNDNMTNGNESWYAYAVKDTTTTGISVQDNEIPKIYTLQQNYPNPFNPITTISFNLPEKSFVSLKVFDVLGREVATLVSEEFSAGNYSQQWNAENVASGIYFYRFQAGSFSETKKLLLLK